jgi:hypothetical protein
MTFMHMRRWLALALIAAAMVAGGLCIESVGLACGTALVVAPAVWEDNAGTQVIVHEAVSRSLEDLGATRLWGRTRRR